MEVLLKATPEEVEDNEKLRKERSICDAVSMEDLVNSMSNSVDGMTRKSYSMLK